MNPAGKVEISSADKLSVFFILSFVFLYFVVPKSLSLQVGGDFREFGAYLKPWYFQRYLLVLVCVLYVVIQLIRGKLSVTLTALVSFFFMMVLSLIHLLEGQYTVFYAPVGAITAYVLVKNSSSVNLTSFSRRLIILFCFLYVIQYAFYRVGIRVTSSFLDPNISGYYLFLCYCIFRFSSLKVFSVIALLFGLASWSRNFYLAVFAFEIVKIPVVENFLKCRLRLFSPLFLSVISIFLVLLVSYFFVLTNNYNDTIGSSADRVSNINDGSNYNRAKANIDMIAKMAEGEFWLLGNGDGVDENTDHRPHNAFLRSIYRYGIPLAALSFLCFFFVCYRLAYDVYPAYIALFSYYAILNDFVTGADLVLLVCFYICCNSLRGESKNRFKKGFAYKFLRLAEKNG